MKEDMLCDSRLVCAAEERERRYTGFKFLMQINEKSDLPKEGDRTGPSDGSEQGELYWGYTVPLRIKQAERRQNTDEAGRERHLGWICSRD